MTTEGLGEFLKREREFQGMSLDALSKASRINKRVLEGIEADNFSVLPPGVVLRGLLKSYALHVGLNPEDVLVRYQRMVPTYQPTLEPPGYEPKLEPWGQIAVVGSILALIIAVTYYWMSR